MAYLATLVVQERCDLNQITPQTWVQSERSFAHPVVCLYTFDTMHVVVHVRHASCPSCGVSVMQFVGSQCRDSFFATFRSVATIKTKPIRAPRHTLTPLAWPTSRNISSAFSCQRKTTPAPPILQHKKRNCTRPPLPTHTEKATSLQKSEECF